MPTKKVTAVKTVEKKAPVKAPAKTNPARELKVLKAFTVAHTLESADLIKAITTAFDKHGKVAVTAQGDKALDRKMQQRVQSIGYRRGFNLNLASAVTETHVVACPRDPSKAKSDIQAPAKPREKKAPAAKTTPAKKVAAGIAKKIVADPKAKAAVEKVAAATKSTPAKKTTTRKATVKRPTDAKALYDASFGKADQEKADLRAAKEAEAAKGGVVIVEDPTPEAVAARTDEPKDIVINGTTVLAVVTPDHDAQVEKGVIDAADAIAKLEVPLPPEAGLRIGMRGTDPVIETNYGAVLARLRGRAVADEVLARINAIRKESAASVA